MNTEEMRLLAQCERDMDSGKQPYVSFNGDRWLFPLDLLAECGIQTGQTVSKHMLYTLTQMMLARVQTEIALNKMRNGR